MTSKKSADEKPKLSNKEAEELVLKLAKQNVPLAKIGQTLKDEHKISAKKVIGKKIKKILEGKIKIDIPEDLGNLIKKAQTLKKHLENHKQDKNAKRGFLVKTSNLRALAKYYKRKGILPKDWEYSS